MMVQTRAQQERKRLTSETDQDKEHQHQHHVPDQDSVSSINEFPGSGNGNDSGKGEGAKTPLQHCPAKKRRRRAGAPESHSTDSTPSIPNPLAQNPQRRSLKRTTSNSSVSSVPSAASSLPVTPEPQPDPEPTSIPHRNPTNTETNNSSASTPVTTPSKLNCTPSTLELAQSESGEPEPPELEKYSDEAPSNLSDLEKDDLLNEEPIETVINANSADLKEPKSVSEAGESEKNTEINPGLRRPVSSNFARSNTGTGTANGIVELTDETEDATSDNATVENLANVEDIDVVTVSSASSPEVEVISLLQSDNELTSSGSDSDSCCENRRKSGKDRDVGNFNSALKNQNQQNSVGAVNDDDVDVIVIQEIDRRFYPDDVSTAAGIPVDDDEVISIGSPVENNDIERDGSENEQTVEHHEFLTEESAVCHVEPNFDCSSNSGLNLDETEPHCSSAPSLTPLAIDTGFVIEMEIETEVEKPLKDDSDESIFEFAGAEAGTGTYSTNETVPVPPPVSGSSSPESTRSEAEVVEVQIQCDSLSPSPVTPVSVICSSSSPTDASPPRLDLSIDLTFDRDLDENQNFHFPVPGQPSSTTSEKDKIEIRFNTLSLQCPAPIPEGGAGHLIPVLNTNDCTVGGQQGQRCNNQMACLSKKKNRNRSQNNNPVKQLPSSVPMLESPNSGSSHLKNANLNSVNSAVIETPSKSQNQNQFQSPNNTDSKSVTPKSKSSTKNPPLGIYTCPKCVSKSYQILHFYKIHLARCCPELAPPDLPLTAKEKKTKSLILSPDYFEKSLNSSSLSSSCQESTVSSQNTPKTTTTTTGTSFKRQKSKVNSRSHSKPVTEYDYDGSRFSPPVSPSIPKFSRAPTTVEAKGGELEWPPPVLKPFQVDSPVSDCGLSPVKVPELEPDRISWASTEIEAEIEVDAVPSIELPMTDKEVQRLESNSTYDHDYSYQSNSPLPTDTQFFLSPPAAAAVPPPAIKTLPKGKGKGKTNPAHGPKCDEKMTKQGTKTSKSSFLELKEKHKIKFFRSQSVQRHLLKFPNQLETKRPALPPVAAPDLNVRKRKRPANSNGTNFNSELLLPAGPPRRSSSTIIHSPAPRAELNLSLSTASVSKMNSENDLGKGKAKVKFPPAPPLKLKEAKVVVRKLKEQEIEIRLQKQQQKRKQEFGDTRSSEISLYGDSSPMMDSSDRSDQHVEDERSIKEGMRTTLRETMENRLSFVNGIQSESTNNRNKMVPDAIPGSVMLSSPRILAEAIVTELAGYFGEAEIFECVEQFRKINGLLSDFSSDLFHRALSGQISPKDLATYELVRKQPEQSNFPFGETVTFDLPSSSTTTATTVAKPPLFQSGIQPVQNSSKAKSKPKPKRKKACVKVTESKKSRAKSKPRKIKGKSVPLGFLPETVLQPEPLPLPTSASKVTSDEDTSEFSSKSDSNLDTNNNNTLYPPFPFASEYPDETPEDNLAYIIHSLEINESSGMFYNDKDNILENLKEAALKTSQQCSSSSNRNSINSKNGNEGASSVNSSATATTTLTSSFPDLNFDPERDEDWPDWISKEVWYGVAYYSFPDINFPPWNN